MSPEQQDLLLLEKPYYNVGDYKLTLFDESDNKIKSIRWVDNRMEALDYVNSLISQGLIASAKLSKVVFDTKYNVHNKAK